MKNILITGCGGAPTLNFARSLRDADPEHKEYHLVGIDSDKFTIHRSECDCSYICPSATDLSYLPYVLEIIKRERIDFIHTQPEIEVFVIGKNRDSIKAAGCRLLMPRQETVEILRDKFESYKIWENNGIKVPKNIFLNSVDDLKKAFAELGESIWIRETIGAAGKGSLSRPNFELAKAWIDFREGWGKTVAAEHLTSRTTTWQSLWFNGKLVAGQGRERLYWEMSSRAQSGVTGITGTGKIINDKDIADLAVKCITTVDKEPHGIFSVDFTYDKDVLPNPTEINIGKFFTTHHFITSAGCNMPHIMTQLAFGEYNGEFNLIDPCQPDLYWVRGMDVRPKLVKGVEIKAKVEEYNEILNKIRGV